MGNGQALIGAIVTVDSVNEVPIVVDCKVTLKNGYTSPIGVQEAIEDYLDTIVLNKNAVNYLPISAAIYNAESVDEVVSLKITVKNTVMDANLSPFISSVAISDNEVPILDVENSNWGI
jgi:hypothetical protein